MDDAEEEPAVVVDGGDRSCVRLLLELRNRVQELRPGTVVRLLASDPAAPLDLPAWCHLTGHAYLGPAPGLWSARLRTPGRAGAAHDPARRPLAPRFPKEGRAQRGTGLVWVMRHSLRGSSPSSKGATPRRSHPVARSSTRARSKKCTANPPCSKMSSPCGVPVP